MQLLYRGPLVVVFAIALLISSVTLSTIIGLGGTPVRRSDPSQPFVLRSHQFSTTVTERTWKVAYVVERAMYIAFAFTILSIVGVMVGSAYQWKIMLDGADHSVLVFVVFLVSVVLPIVACFVAPY